MEGSRGFRDGLRRPLSEYMYSYRKCKEKFGGKGVSIGVEDNGSCVGEKLASRHAILSTERSFRTGTLAGAVLAGYPGAICQ